MSAAVRHDHCLTFRLPLPPDLQGLAQACCCISRSTAQLERETWVSDIDSEPPPWKRASRSACRAWCVYGIIRGGGRGQDPDMLWGNEDKQ